MTIDPATLPEDTVVESHCNARDCFHYDTAGATADMGRVVVRTYSPDPLPSQEVPYDRWPSVRKGARVQIVCIDGTVATLTVDGASNGCIESPCHGFPTHAIARVFVLDEPADPDADLIERIVDIVGNAEAYPTKDKTYARAIIAAVREAGA